MTESTTALWVEDGKDERHTSAPKNRRDGFFGVSRKHIYMFGVPIAVLVTCVFLGLATWSLGKVTPRQPGNSLQDYGSSSDSGDHHGLSNIEVVIPPRAAAEVGVPVVKTFSSSASLFTRRVTKRRRARRMTQKGDLLKVAQIEDPNTETMPCSTGHCSNQSDYLRQTMNFAADPCHDFYDYVCGRYRGHPDGPYAEVEETIRNATIPVLSTVRVPVFNQNAFQKAAALYQACYAFAVSSRSELEQLKAFMVSLQLDLLNLDASREVNPVYMVARLSLDAGIPVLFDLKLFDDYFVEGKRALQFKISDSQEAWEKKRARLSTNTSAKVLTYISKQILHYPGYDPQNLKHEALIQEIYNYDEALITVLKTDVQGKTQFLSRPVEHMAVHTVPTITPAQWSGALTQYTKGTYGGQDVIQFQEDVLAVLVGQLKSAAWGADGFRTMLAWGLFDGLVDYALPQNVVFGKNKEEACYHHVMEVMEYAATSRYLRNVVRWTARTRANDLFLKARDSIRAYIDVNDRFQQAEKVSALRTLFFMKVIICSPEQRLDEIFVNKHFASFPDIPATGRFLDAWFKALSGRAHQKWTDQTHVLFNTSRASPFYLKRNNSVVIPAGALLPVSLYADGDPALNVGSLGSALIHQIMEAYDIEEFDKCYTKETKNRFHEAMRCLRESHTKAGYPAPEPANHSTDLENLADFVATDVGYDLYWTLHSEERSWTLPEVNLTGEQLVIVGRCMTLCKLDDLTPTGSLAGPRARCNVPAMNLHMFSRAFNCTASARMNADPQCTFWF